MSRFSKAVKRITRKVAPVATQGMWNPGAKSEGSDESGQRSAAAKRLVDQSKQAGSGQINYTTEETT